MGKTPENTVIHSGCNMIFLRKWATKECFQWENCYVFTNEYAQCNGWICLVEENNFAGLQQTIKINSNTIDFEPDNFKWMNEILIIIFSLSVYV